MTSRKQPEKGSGRSARKRLRPNIDFTTALSNSIGEGVYALDLDGLLIYMNPAAERMLGWKQEELVDRNMHEAIHFQHPDGTPFPAEECPLIAVIESNQTISNDDDVFIRKNGQSFPVSYTSSPMRFEGETVGAVLSFRDITERKRAERRLAAQHAATRILSESSTLEEAAPRILQAICESLRWTVGALWRMDSASGRLHCVEIWHIPSAEVAEFAEQTKRKTFAPDEGLPGRVWSSREPSWLPDVAGDPNFPRAPIAVKEGLHSAFAFPVMSDGEVLCVMEFLCHEIRQPDEDVMAMISIIGIQVGQFIERKRAEAAQRESEEHYRIVAETASDAIITIDDDCMIQFANHAAEKIFGYGSHELLGQNLTMLMPDYLRHMHRAGLQRYLDTGRKHISWSGVELPGLHKDGREIPLELSFGEFFKNGKHFFTGIARDITGRKRVEAQLQASEQRYRYLTEAMPQFVWASDANGAHVYFNQRWYEFTGLTEDESMGFGFAEALHPEDKERTLAQWKRAWRDDAGYEIEYRFYSRPRNEYRWFLGRAVPVRNEAGEIIQWVGTCTDIEEQKRMEEALGQLNREREQMLEEVSTPVVPVWRGVLALPIIGSLDTTRMQRAMEAALNSVMRTGARACIIDITGARIIDSHAVANLSNLVSALKLIGAEAIVTGVSAHAAHSLVSLGLDLSGMRTHRTFAEALAWLVKTIPHTNGKEQE